MAEPEVASQAPHEQAVSNIESMFLRREGGEEPQNGGRPRAENGRFAPTGPQNQEPALAEAQGTEQPTDTEGQEPAQGAAPQSEEVEVEIEGEKYLVPKKISDRFIQHADYTRKTQDVAEMRRVLSAEREAAGLEKAFADATVQERNQLSVLEAQIAQYQGINWGAIEDVGQLVKYRESLNQLKEQRADLQEQVKAKRGQFDERIKGLTQEAIAAGNKYIEQHIKGFDDSKKKQLFEYALSEGFTQTELAGVKDPRVVVSLWKASQWDALQASKPGIQNKAQQAAPVVRPGATQKPVSRVAQLNKAFKDAKSSKDKAAIAEDYFASRLGGG